MKIFNLFRNKKASDATSNDCEATNVVEEVCNSSTQNACNSEKVEKEQVESAKEPVDSAAKSKNVHNLIILDESGSMQLIYQAALSGLNETLQTIRNAETDHENQKHFVSLISFNSGNYNEIYNNTPAQDALDITEEQYKPMCNTPLYDAMGRAINDLRSKVGQQDKVLVTIITDGMENASREYQRPAIKALVDALKAEGWVFTYIGANQDVEAVSKSMSISNCLAFDANEDSTRKMFAKEMRSRRKFFDKLDFDMPDEDLSENYFIDID